MTMIFKWTIDNFTSKLDPQNRGPITSEKFYSHSNRCTWHLVLYPSPKHGRTDPKLEGLIGLYVYLDKGPFNKKMNAWAKFCILDLKDDKVIYQKGRKIRKFFAGTDQWYDEGMDNFIPRSEILKYLKQDKLRIGLELTFTSFIDVDLSSIPFDKDYLEYLNTGDLSDFEIINAKGKATGVHKVFMAKNSPVFARMFKSGMKEALEGRVTIPDIHPTALSKMLTFLYSGKLKITNNDIGDGLDFLEPLDLIKKIIHAANKYEIVPLQENCEKYLIDNCTGNIDTVLSFLEFAQKYNCSKLKQAMIKFIEDKNSVLLKTKEWENFVEKEPRLANEILVKIIADLTVIPRPGAGRKRKIGT